MGGCQNYGPFLRTLNIRGRIITGTQKGTIILTTIYVVLGGRGFLKSEALPSVNNPTRFRLRVWEWGMVGCQHSDLFLSLKYFRQRGTYIEPSTLNPKPKPWSNSFYKAPQTHYQFLKRWDGYLVRHRAVLQSAKP